MDVPLAVFSWQRTWTGGLTRYHKTQNTFSGRITMQNVQWLTAKEVLKVNAAEPGTVENDGEGPLCP